MKLKPCPFCGNPEDTKPESVFLWRVYDLPITHEDAYDIVVRCVWCGVCGEVCSTEKEAVKSWNTRQESSG